MFIASYAVLRLALFPAALVWLALDVRDMTPDVARGLGFFEFGVYPVANLFIFGLSVAWAVPFLFPKKTVVTADLKKRR